MPQRRKSRPGRRSRQPARKPSPASKASRKPRQRPGRRLSARTLKLTPAQIRERLDAQHARAAVARQRRKAEGARNKYRPGKRVRGTLQMVNEAGRVLPRGKGKKGFLVYVTKTGKKQLVHGVGKEQWKARKITDAAPPYKPNLKKAIRAFELNRLELMASGKTVLKAGRRQLGAPGTKRTKKDPAPLIVRPGSGAWDFTDKTSNKIARSIKKALDEQKSHRTFTISALVAMKDGQTVEMKVPIDKPDHIAIKLGGIQNFVRMKFYASLARELAHIGIVTAGSANHIRNLKRNEGLPEEEWKDARGDSWAGRGLEVVAIEAIEWKIEQSTT